MGGDRERKEFFRGLQEELRIDFEEIKNESMRGGWRI